MVAVAARHALVVGSEGQDGSLLMDSLRKRGGAVSGITRKGLHASGETRPMDITDSSQVKALISQLKPSEVYYLPAFHHSSEELPPDDEELFVKSMDVHCTAAVSFMEAIKGGSPSTRFFYAASSHVFGGVGSPLRDEETPVKPDTIYGITKAAGLSACRYYRARGVFAAGGILFPHESSLRRGAFLSKKITRAVADARSGKDTTVLLGDLESGADWGYAPDFIEAMQRMLALDAPDDFVVATGAYHTALEFAQAAFGAVGLDYRRYVRTSSDLIRRRTAACAGNSEKLKRQTGWAPSVTFEEMVGRLVAAEISARATV